MKIDRARYGTEVAASIAEGSSEMLAQIETWHISHDIGLSNGEVAPGARMRLVATIVFPDEFRDHELLAEIRGMPNVRLWEDIDSDHLCLGHINWFGEEEPSTLCIAADVTLEAFHNLSRLLLDTDFKHKPALQATAIGLRSLEFAERELIKGVAVIDVSVAVHSQQEAGEHIE